MKNEQQIKKRLKLILLIELAFSSIPFILLLIFTTNPIFIMLSLLIPIFVLLNQLMGWGLI